LVEHAFSTSIGRYRFDSTSGLLVYLEPMIAENISDAS
jgi:hypothetical protein